MMLIDVQRNTVQEMALTILKKIVKWVMLAQYIPRSNPYLSNFQTSDKSFWYNSRKEMVWSYIKPFPLHASEPCKGHNNGCYSYDHL
ncbi:hypothetical protein Bca4012_009329 [Brassica carinata]